MNWFRRLWRWYFGPEIEVRTRPIVNPSNDDATRAERELPIAVRADRTKRFYSERDLRVVTSDGTLLDGQHRLLAAQTGSTTAER